MPTRLTPPPPTVDPPHSHLQHPPRRKTLRFAQERARQPNAAFSDQRSVARTKRPRSPSIANTPDEAQSALKRARVGPVQTRLPRLSRGLGRGSSGFLKKRLRQLRHIGSVWVLPKHEQSIIPSKKILPTTRPRLAVPPKHRSGVLFELLVTPARRQPPSHATPFSHRSPINNLDAEDEREPRPVTYNGFLRFAYPKQRLSHRLKRKLQVSQWLDVTIPLVLAAFMENRRQTQSGRLEPRPIPFATCSCRTSVLKVVCLSWDRTCCFKVLSTCANGCFVFQRAGFQERILSVCACSPASLQLVQAGYFPCSPLRPSLAVDINFLEFVCTGFSIMSPNVTGWARTLQAFLAARGYRLKGEVCAHQTK